MFMPADRPIVFLAFADARSDLSSLKVEGWSLKDQFHKLKQRGVIAHVEVEENASLDRIYSVFQEYRDRISLFHFGGHAGGDRLLLQSAFEPRPAYAEGLATLLGKQRGLKLVFLNGCSTRPQVKRLLDAGVPAVIATARPINDQVATEFAVAFYQALTTGYRNENRQVTGGCSLAAAFEQAEGMIKAARGGNSRDLVAVMPTHEDVTDDLGFPWAVQYRKGSDHIERWNLFEDDPLFNLPDLPADIGWPVEPYRNLEYFQRDHARIFFGRGRAIRELYNLLTLPADSAEARLLFYYGQTGVGKTSVLAAGLLPRVETLFETKYCRRSAQDGLLGTLRAELAPGVRPFDLGSACLKIEHEAQRPLVIVLDQAEEAFTKPLVGLRPKEEIRALFEAVYQAFAPTRPERPRGRLILSFRKEWLAEFNEIRKALNLDIKPKMLDPLDRPGVIEAIEGPAEHFGLEIKPDRDDLKPGEATLAEFMSHDMFDTLANPQTEQESPIAPTLQILLARMWKEANDPKRLRGQPTFDRAFYQELKGKGFKLDEVIQEQFAKIAELGGLREAVETGLLLDLLEFFTTHEGTAGAHTRKQIHDRYPHQPAERLDALLEACQNRYLLAHVGVGADGTAAYRLTHDTLAPLLRERFRVSPDLAQRARRLLEGRAATWKGQPTDLVPERDLASVEEGLPWMRTLEKDEPALLAASRQAEERRVAEEEERQRQLREAEDRRKQETVRRLRATRIGLGVSLTLLVLAGWQWREATKSADEARTETRIAESRRLAVLSDAARPQRLDVAMLLALEAAKEEDTLEARGSLQSSLDARPEVVRFLHVHEGAVSSVAFGPEGQIAAGYSDGVVLFDARGERLRHTPLEVTEGSLTSVVFGPDGRIAARYIVGGVREDGGVVLFDARGERLRPKPLEVTEGSVESVAFGPDGRIAAGYGAGTVGEVGFYKGRIVEGYTSRVGGVVLFDARGERLRPKPLEVTEGRVTRVAFGPEGQIAAGYDVSGVGDVAGVVLFDARGERLRPTPLVEVKKGNITSVAFGPEGQIATGYNVRGGGDGVMLFDARGERLRTAEVKEGSVTSVTFGPEGKIAAGHSHGVVLFDARGERLRPEPLEVTEGSVESVAFGPDGRIAAGYSDGVVLFDARGGRRRPTPLVEVREGHVTSVAFGPEGQIATGYSVRGPGDGVMLFDAQGQRLRPTPLEVTEGDVESVAFGPEGQIAAGYYGGYVRSVDVGLRFDSGVKLFDARGEQLRPTPLKVTEGHVTSVAFGPDGRIAAGYGGGGYDVAGNVDLGDVVGGVVLFDARGERLRPKPLEVTEGRVTSVAFGPGGQIAAGYGFGSGTGLGVVLFDARGERLRTKPLEVRGREVTSVAFGPEGRIATGYGFGSGTGLGGVVLFDARGEQLRTAEVKDGSVTSVTFGPEGKIAAGYDGGVVLFDARGERLRPTPLEVKEGGVTSVAFRPEGQIAAGYRRGGIGGVVLFDAADPAWWQRKAGQVANRNFTWEEWRQFFPDTRYRRTIRSCTWPHDLPEAERKQAEAFEKEHPERSDAS
jgi:WD40 repeat protein